MGIDLSVELPVREIATGASAPEMPRGGQGISDSLASVWRELIAPPLICAERYWAFAVKVAVILAEDEGADPPTCVAITFMLLAVTVAEIGPVALRDVICQSGRCNASGDLVHLVVAQSLRGK